MSTSGQHNSGLLPASMALGRSELHGRGGGSRLPASQARLIGVVRLVLLGIFAALLARIFWMILAPLPAPAEVPVIVSEQQVAPTPDPDTRTHARNPFAVSAVEFAEVSTPLVPDTAITETTLNLTLHGVYIDGDRSNVIIDANNGRGQGVFRIGDEITDGVELTEVRPGEAIISRGGVREALRMVRDEESISPRGGQARRERATRQRATRERANTQSSGAPRDANLPRVPRANINSNDLQKILQVRRRTEANGRRLLTLFPAGDRRAFAEAGLVAQDILLSVNGTPPPEDIRQLYQLMDRFSGSGFLSLVIERDGIPRTISMTFTPTVTGPDGEGVDPSTFDGGELGDEVEL